MTLPDRNNPYNFDEFLEWRDGLDAYRDDPFIQQVVRHFCGDEQEQVDAAARELSPKVSSRWRDLSERIARLEQRPYLMHFDGHNHRVDRIVRPHEAELLEGEVFSEGLFSSATSRWTRLVKMYLIYQNGEACVSCPLVCTEGLVELLERFADTPELNQILQHCKEGVEGRFGIGAQYLSEIQGGSDVPANLVEAVSDGDGWRLYGTKFFCSATHADYAVVTAKPRGSGKVGIFVVPSWLPGDREHERRNSFTIDRLKWKMGTSELPTAEITFDGAKAFQVGPLERGIANVVGIVLTYSRLTVGLSSAACMTRAAREARAYAGFRRAFGHTIGKLPMVVGQLEQIERDAKRTTAAAFKIYGQVIETGVGGKMISDEPPEVLQRRFEVRELVMLQKIATTWDATDQLRAAISILGGHGVIEDFSSLPRLFRDAAVNELWEGPRNVLLTQIHRDCRRAAELYPPEAFVANLLRGADGTRVKELGDEMAELVAHPDLMEIDEKTIGICRQWDSFCHELFHAYQDVALAEVEAGS